MFLKITFLERLRTEGFGISIKKFKGKDVNKADCFLKETQDQEGGGVGWGHQVVYC
jgi:hypothetical protein